MLRISPWISNLSPRPKPVTKFGDAGNTAMQIQEALQTSRANYEQARSDRENAQRRADEANQYLGPAQNNASQVQDYQHRRQDVQGEVLRLQQQRRNIEDRLQQLYSNIRQY